MKKLDLRLWRMIKQSKGQFFSIAAVIILGLAIYVSFSMTAVNLENTKNYYYEITNFGDIIVQLVRIPKGAVEDLRKIEGVEMVQGRVSFQVPFRVQDPREKVTVKIVSIPQTPEQIFSLYMLEGTPLRNDLKSTVVLEQFSDARGIRIGDKISPYINGRAHPLEVVGITASSEHVYLMENEQALLPAPEKFGVLYVSEDFAQSAYGYRDSYNEVLIRVKDLDQIDEIADKLEDRLDKYGVKRVIKREDQLSNRMLSEEISQLQKTSTAIPLLFLIVASIVIVIMLSRIVKNDRTVIGVLKAMGYGNGEILFHYTKYALAIGVFGSFIGILAGIQLSGMLANMYIQYYNIPILKQDIYYIYMVYAILLTSVFCIVSGLLAAKSVLKIMPADSMRPEAPKTGKRVFLEKIQFIWSPLTFSWKMVIRNVARGKKRFAFLILGLALTYGINVVPVYMFEGMISMFELQYGDFQRMDYTIEFSRPMHKRVVGEMKQLIEVDHIEPKLEIPFELKQGWRKKVVTIIGLPRDTKLYAFKDKAGNAISLPENGILLTEGLAKALNVSIGDQILIKNYLPGKSDVHVEVRGIIRQYLGINAYMNIEVMDGQLAEKGMITGVSFLSRDQVREKLTNVKNISAIQSITDMKNSFMQFLDSVMVSTTVMMLFGGILGFAIVYNSTIISIAERQMEFSSLRVLGFDKRDIVQMITKENGLMTIIAILLGIPVGWAMCNGISEAFNTDLYTFPVIITPATYLYAAAGTILFVGIAQLATIRKIYHLNFIDALKNRVS